MAYRHRNIPVTSKQQVEVQTDARLLEHSFFDQELQGWHSQFVRSSLREKDTFSSRSICRPFGGQQLLKDIQKTVQDMREQPFDEKLFGKRMEIIEGQIVGLLKRDYLVNSSADCSEEGWSSYYSTLNDKQKEVIRLMNEKIYADMRTVKLQRRIQALEQQVEQLRISLVHSTEAVQQNKEYSSFFDKMTTIIQTSQKKGIDIEKLFEEQCLPAYTEFSFNLNAATRLINKEVKVNSRPLVLSIAREMDRLLKEHEFSEEKQEETVISLIDNFKAMRGVDYLKGQFQRSQRTETAEANLKNMLSLFKHEIQCIQADHPHLKGAEKLDWLTRRLEEEGIDMIEINGWMNLATTSIRLHEVQGEETKLRELIGILAGEFKRIYMKFPELQTHCSSKISQLFQSELLIELIEGASIERLKEIVVHEIKEVRVDDVYTYDNSKEMKMVFHLKAMLKKLLEQIMGIRAKHGIEFTLDAALIAMIEEQCGDLDVDSIIEMFRPPARYIQAPIVIENKVYDTMSFEKGVALTTTKPIVFKEDQQKIYTAIKEVPVYIERPVECEVIKNIPFEVKTEKLVQVPTTREIIVERIVQMPKEILVEVEKVVAMDNREEVIKEVEVDKIIRDIEVRQIERIVETKIQELVEVTKTVERIVPQCETKEIIKEVEIRVPHIINKTEIVQIEKTVPVVIRNEYAVEVISEIPIEIKKPQIQIVELTEYRDKPIVVTNTVENIIEVELKVEKQLVKQVPKEVYIDRSHFIKGDKEEQIVEVEVFIDKPIIQEVMVTKEVDRQKIVPLYIREQVPVLTEVKTPFICERIKELEVEKIQVVTARQEVVKPVEVDRPVPIIVEKEIVKVQPQFIDRIIEKIVQVPRIVEIERIVEKIVPVPRIVERIIQVPKIVEKIVVERVYELQIVEIPVPQIEVQTIEVPIEIEVIKTVIVKEVIYETVEVEKIVELKVEVEKIVEIEVERQVPYEVIREIPVQTYRDRIEYQKVEIHETRVEPIEVQIPFYVQEKVPFIVEKPVRTHDVIKEVEYEKIYTEREKEVLIETEKLVVEKCIERVPIHEKEVVTVEVEKIVQVREEVCVEVEREKIVEVETRIEQIKEIFVEIEKIVPIIHEKLITISVNELITTPELIQVPKIVELKHEKQIPVAVPVREERSDTRVIHNILEVEKRIEVPTEIQICREQIREVVNQVQCIINNETIKEIKEEIIIEGCNKIEVVEIEGETKVQELKSCDTKVEVGDKISQKLVEKIVLLPQLVELVKNIHHISEVNQLGVAVDVDVNVQTEKFIGVSSDLKKGLVELLSSFKANVGRQPELKNLIAIIEKYLKVVDTWISFPKLIEIEKIIEKEIEKERIVMVPTENKERETTIFFIMEKMIAELRRIKEAHKINLGLDDQILNIFFTEKLCSEDIERKISEMRESLINKSCSYGSINFSQAFMVGNGLEDALRNEAQSSYHRITIKEQQQEIEDLRRMMDRLQTEEHNLKTVNQMIVNSNNTLLRTLEKHREHIEPEEFQISIRSHRSIYDDLISQKRSTLISSMNRQIKFTESAYVSQSGVQESSEISVSAQQESYLGDLIGKLNKYEAENQSFVKKSRVLESEVHSYRDELNVKNSIIKRLENDFESKLSRAREELAKSPNVNKDVLEDNRKMQQKLRHLEKEYTTEKNNAERARRDLERTAEGQKRDITRELERKEKESKDITEKNRKQFERQLKKVSTDLDRIKGIKQKLEADMAELRQKHSEEIKSIREQQLSGATDKHNQLLNENISFRKKYDSLQVEYEKLKKAAVDNNSTNDRETQKLKSEIEKLQIEKREWSKKQKEGFLGLPEETKLINVKIELEKKIKNMEADLSKYRNKDESSVGELRGLKDKVKNLEIQLEIARKELEASHKMRSTTFKSGFKSGVSDSEFVEGSGSASVTRSPRGGYYKSTEEKSYISPQSVLSEEKLEEVRSSSSRYSHEEYEESSSIYKSQMALRQFMDIKHEDKDKDVFTTFVMIKIIEAIEREAENGVYHSYNPSNIHIHNFDPRSLDRMTIKFGANIVDKKNRNDGLYLSSEVLSGSISTKKSVVFCLGVILDELIHGSLFFRSMEEIQNSQIEFKVRGEKLNPILKNTLFEMMNKEPSKRLELVEAKRRLSLQKYITAEGRGSVTVTQRVGRKTEM